LWRFLIAISGWLLFLYFFRLDWVGNYRVAGRDKIQMAGFIFIMAGIAF